MEKDKTLSMTKSGIIGLVVLIVILIGGYSILTRSGNNGLVSVTGTSTNTLSGTSTGANSSSTVTGATSTHATTSGDVGPNTDNTNETEDNSATSKENNGKNVFGGGTAGEVTSPSDTSDASDADNSSDITVDTQSDSNRVEAFQRRAPRIAYESSNTGVSFEFPNTWKINEEVHRNGDGTRDVITMGAHFAGGMKAEMTITTFKNVKVFANGEGEDVDAHTKVIHLKDVVGNGKQVVIGRKYQTGLECKGEDLNCAGTSYVIPVSGHMTQNGWQGEVIQVSYGVFQTQNYNGPDVHVSPNALYGVAHSVFVGVANSISVNGVGIGGVSAP